MNRKTILAALAGLSLAVGAAGAAGAQDLAHPRRAEVNQRLDRQERRIHVAEARGEMSPKKAHRLERADHRVRMAERRSAYRHDGHISRMEQARLNHRETRVAHRIG